MVIIIQQPENYLEVSININHSIAFQNTPDDTNDGGQLTVSSKVLTFYVIKTQPNLVKNTFILNIILV